MKKLWAPKQIAILLGRSRTFVALFFGMMSFCPAMGEASSVTEDFTSATFRSVSPAPTAVWNLSTGRVHPPLRLYRWNNGTTTGNATFSVGDGSNGSFNSTRYTEFSDGGNVAGQIIRLNTDTYSDLNFTDFTLNSGWTIRPTGSKPLIIRSQSTVVIQGVIDCSGEDGGSFVLYDGTNASATVTGGSGRCGGGAGGPGGNFSSAAGSNGTAGVQLTPSPYALAVLPAAGGIGTAGAGSGGGGSTTLGQTAGSGGGGATYGDSGNASNGANGTGGSGGTGATPGILDRLFEVIAGGSGGGGGGAYWGGATISAGVSSSGGGGGGGGGTILIFAAGHVTVESTGQIKADGGHGGYNSGGAPALANGGEGGGGGGGSILIFSGGTATLNGPNPSIAPASSIGGRRKPSASADSGFGNTGRTWIADSTLTSLTSNCQSDGGPTYEEPAPNLTEVGCVQYQTGSFSAYSKSITIPTTNPRLQGFSSNRYLPGGSTLTLEAAASSDNFATDTTGWLSSSSLLAGVTQKGYVQFRLTLTNDNTSTPAYVDSVQFDYNDLNREKFDFQAAGCGRISTRSDLSQKSHLTYGRSESRQGLGALLLWLLPLVLPLIVYLKKRRQMKWRYE